MKKAVYARINSGELPAVKLGEKSIRIRVEDVEAYEAARMCAQPDLDPDEVTRIQQRVAAWPQLTREQQAVIRSAFRGGGA
jgi:excisionase family DNA binding protein